MTVDKLGEFLILQLPNFAGLLICVAVCVKIIFEQRKDIQRLQNRINELCGDETPDEIDKGL